MYLSILIISAFLLTTAHAGDLPDCFVYLDELIPNLSVELRYAGDNNFVGKPIDGYESNRCIVTAEAGYALKRAQIALNSFGLGLKIFDSYRPRRAVLHFIRWADDPEDTKMKEQYYPSVKKADLFESGYLGKKSNHSKGSTVDLTLIVLDTGEELDMGSPYDFFDEQSHVLYENITGQQKANRMLLNGVMRDLGFNPAETEWWHFALKNEPYPDTFFDFVIK